MERSSTKQRILEEALRLFSQKGYDAVSVEEIASAVSIKAPSLYKHYKSKRAIFDAIFGEMQSRYDAQAASMHLHLTDGNSDEGRFLKISAEELIRAVRELVSYSLHDPLVSRFRRLMTIEQFRSDEIAALYTERYVERMLSYHEALFEALMGKGDLKKGDARAMAWQYVSPVLVLLSVCDRQPEREEEAMGQIEVHIRQFMKIYQGGNET